MSVLAFVLFLVLRFCLCVLGHWAKSIFIFETACIELEARLERNLIFENFKISSSDGLDDIIDSMTWAPYDRPYIVRNEYLSVLEFRLVLTACNKRR